MARVRSLLFRFGKDGDTGAGWFDGSAGLDESVHWVGSFNP